jgi:hypothetical protein
MLEQVLTKVQVICVLATMRSERSQGLVEASLGVLLVRHVATVLVQLVLQRTALAV